VNTLQQIGKYFSDVHWHELAVCLNIAQRIEEDGVVKIFDPMFDSYENDSPPYVLRNTVDEMCLSCPVQKICYDYGVKNMEPGVWGGVYLNNGKHDQTRNNHKTRETWRRIKSAVTK